MFFNEFSVIVAAGKTQPIRRVRVTDRMLLFGMAGIAKAVRLTQILTMARLAGDVTDQNHFIGVKFLGRFVEPILGMCRNVDWRFYLSATGQEYNQQYAI